MNIQSISNQPVSDDNDLAKVLSGTDGQLPTDDETDTAPPPEAEAEDQAPPVEVEEVVKNEDATPEPIANASDHELLEKIKKQALEELRPLVDKLDLPPDEMFDILLLIIRSTDDESLIEKAHETAVKIEDEAREAQALLDIIKEVDYFSNK